MKAASEGPISLVSAPSDGAEEDWAAELTERHFPLPWLVEELEACFYVCDSAGQKIGICLFRGGARPASGSKTANA